ncbi:HAMP domain-containing sensor histidine kinase [Methylobacterium sp. EM32]|uniref:sensor histidine kinase n=1 Tax=Methylobacterium sp. EM32 TaxID=3163481 RepID=UPI0033B556BC
MRAQQRTLPEPIVLPGIRLAMVPGAPRCDIAIAWEAARGEHAVLTTVDQVDRPIDHWVLQQRRGQRLLEEKIIAASRELERMNRNLRDFASVAAHDLRAPLHPIVGDSLDTIEGCAARLNRMTRGLLDYARLSAESHTFEAVDLGRVVLDATRNLALDLGAAAADLDVGPLPVVNGVPALLTNLFQNLIANSIRYRELARPLRIEIRARPGGARPDHGAQPGIGVPAAFHEAIFETFARVPNGRAPNGVGLGLSICRRIVELHGWRIGVVADDAPGACFGIDRGQSDNRSKPDSIRTGRSFLVSHRPFPDYCSDSGRRSGKGAGVSIRILFDELVDFHPTHDLILRCDRREPRRKPPVIAVTSGGLLRGSLRSHLRMRLWMG